jgi:hypothetical protein
MRKRWSLWLCILIITVLLFSGVGCNNADPNRKQGDSKEEDDYQVDLSAADVPEYLNVDAMAQRSYELAFMLAQTNFDSPEKMSVNAMVQFAFCHLFYENLCEMPASGVKYREADADEIRSVIIKYFGDVNVDIEKSDLYNRGHQKFEMWEPHYGTALYYKAEARRSEDGFIEVTAVFYGDEEKSQVSGRTVLTVQDENGSIVIKKLSSSLQ